MKLYGVFVFVTVLFALLSAIRYMNMSNRDSRVYNISSNPTELQTINYEVTQTCQNLTQNCYNLTRNCNPSIGTSWRRCCVTAGSCFCSHSLCSPAGNLKKKKIITRKKRPTTLQFITVTENCNPKLLQFNRKL